MSEKSQFFKVYVKLTGIKKRQRLVKWHMEAIAKLDHKPLDNEIKELELVAKEYIKTNFREYPNRFRLDIQAFKSDGLFTTRLILGDKDDINLEVTI